MSRLFTGSCVALVTPFTDTGVDYDKLGELIEFQIASKTDAILVCGTTGESSTQTTEEHIDVIKYAVEKVKGRVPVIAGTGSNETAYAIELNQASEEAGVDGVLMVTPYYNKTTQKGLYEHYKIVAEETKLPIILYNVPSRTGLNIAAETVAKLAEIDNIVGIKEASGNISLVAKIAQLTEGKFDIYAGNDDQVVPILSLGGAGVISTMANVVPTETHEMVAAYLSGDVKKAAEYQLRLLDLIDALFIEVNPIPVKTALNMMGYHVGPCRRPLAEMEEKNAKLLQETLLKYGLIK